MKYSSKLVLRCWTFGITFSRSHRLPPASATSRKTAKYLPGLVSAVRCWIMLSLLCPGTDVRVLVFDASMRFTPGGYSRGHMFCQADTAPDYLFAGHSLRSRHCQSAFACGPVHPGLSSWGILSRPCGTDRDLP